MNIRKYRLLLLLLAIWFGCAGAFPAPAATATASPFAQGPGYEPGAYDYDAAQPTAFNWTRQSRFTGSSDHDVKWTLEAGDAIYSTPAIGADGTLYVGSYDGKLYALDSKTGKLKWTFETSGAIASSPAIGADGTIYIGSGNGRLYALDPYAADDIQRVKWSYATGDRIYSSPVIGRDGTIYISSYDGKLYALDSNAAHDDERVIWTYEIGGETDSSPAIGTDGTIYVGSGDGVFYALDSDADDEAHRLKWSFEPETAEDCLWMMDGPCPIYSSPAIDADGIIYVGSDDGYVYALDSNAVDDESRLKWSYETWGSVLSSPAIGTDGTVYVGSYDGVLYALDSNAAVDDEREKWSFDTSMSTWSIIISSPVIGADGMIYIGSIGWYGDGALYALDPNGENKDEQLKWSFTTESTIRSSPVIGPDGTIYIGADDHKLYAIGTSTIAAPHAVAAVGDESAVKLAWEAVDGAVGYMVYHYQGTSAPVQQDQWKLVNDDELIIETDYTVENLTAGELYWFAVKAVGTGGIESDFSEHASATSYTNVTQVSELARIQVAKGTKLEGLHFPTETKVQLADGSEIDLPIAWDLTNINYDGGHVGTYTITGELQRPGYVHNPHNLQVQQVVRVLPSTNAMLSNIHLDGEPLQGFKSEIYTYTVHYPFAKDQVTVTASAFEPQAIYEIIGGNPQRLQVGSNPIEIVVTAENGDIQSYTIHVIRKQDASGGYQSGGGWYLSNDADLKAIDILADGEHLLLTPAFASEVLTYSAETEAEQIELRASAAHTTARVMWNDQTLGDAVLAELEVGENDFELIVIAENGTRKTYKLTINRKISKLDKPEAPDLIFTDSEGHWSERYLKDAIYKGFINGYSDGSFRPDHPITRAEVAVMLAGVLKLEDKGIALAFKDSDMIEDWAKQAVARTAQSGIIKGYADGTFRPNAHITRAELAVMITRAMQLPIVDSNISTKFADDAVIPVWAKGEVKAIYEFGIVSGRGGNKFVPNATATRAEVVVMLLRMMERK